MIPVIDSQAPDFGELVLDACAKTGFFAVRNHGINERQFSEVRNLCVDLFAVDDSVKRRNRITPDNYRGFIPLGFFTPNRAEVSGSSTDQYEGFKLHWECPPHDPARSESSLYGANRWIDELPRMSKIISDYWLACDHLASRLIDEVANFLNVEKSVMQTWHQAPLTNMTLLHYPPNTPNLNPSGIHPHKDSNVFTFLYPDPAGGLEIRTEDGEWLEVETQPDTLLVNTGEMLELWSGGHIVATPHRVINRTGQSRYAFPWFLVPNHKVVVRPLVESVPGFDRPDQPVGAFSAEVWRTNWSDASPSDAGHDLGTLDR